MGSLRDLPVFSPKSLFTEAPVGLRRPWGSLQVSEWTFSARRIHPPPRQDQVDLFLLCVFFPSAGPLPTERHNSQWGVVVTQYVYE